MAISMRQASAKTTVPAVGQGPTVGVAPRGRRRPGLLVAGAGLALIGGLSATTLAAGAGDREPVLVLARDVPAGAELNSADLSTAMAAVDAGVQVVPAGRVGWVVGMVAASALPAGSVLAPGDVVPDGPPGPGQVAVPLPVTAQMMPAAGLAPGDRLLVVDTPPEQSDPTPGDPVQFAVQVATVGEPDVNGVAVVDVVAAAVDGPQVAKRAATGRFVLIVERAQEVEP